MWVLLILTFSFSQPFWVSDNCLASSEHLKKYTQAMLYHQRSRLYSHELKCAGCIKNCCKPENYKQKFIYLYIYVCILVLANEELLPINLLSRASQETSYVAQMWSEGHGLKTYFALILLWVRIWFSVILEGVLIQKTTERQGASKGFQVERRFLNICSGVPDRVRYTVPTSLHPGCHIPQM